MVLSRRAQRLEKSPTLGAAEMVRKLIDQKEDVVRFDIGEPDFQTPQHIKEAGIAAINEGLTHYTSARGLPELRDALVADQSGKGLAVKPANIAVFPGSKIGLFAVMSLLVDSGGQVLIQDPVWPTYASIIRYLGGEPVEVPCGDDEQDSGLTAAFEARMNERTKAVIVNSPCNPTGATLDEETVEGILAICAKRRIPLVLDRIYSALVYDGSMERIPATDLESGSLLIVSGFSKEYAMTGWRLGYTVASKDFTDKLVDFQDNTTTCAPAFVQKAGVAALTGERGWQKAMNREYRVRRDLMVDEIRGIPGWRCSTPAGAFYCFPKVHASDSVAFAKSLLSQWKVSCVAGAYFGTHGEGHVRLSYATKTEKIREGMKRIREAVTGTE